MWLRAIGLPEGVSVVISELLDAVAHLGRGEGPHCLLTDFSARWAVGGWGTAQDVCCVSLNLRCSIVFDITSDNLLLYK